MVSSLRRKQHKFMHTAPLHKRQAFVSAHLAEDLAGKIGKRSIHLHKGDKVKIARGENKGTIAKIEEIDLKDSRVYLENLTTTKVNGAKARIPLHPSNLIIIELGSEDKRRKEALNRVSKGA
jgi:large subunit ribosomal protein L24